MLPPSGPSTIWKEWFFKQKKKQRSQRPHKSDKRDSPKISRSRGGVKQLTKTWLFQELSARPSTNRNRKIVMNKTNPVHRTITIMTNVICQKMSRSQVPQNLEKTWLFKKHRVSRAWTWSLKKIFFPQFKVYVLIKLLNARVTEKILGLGYNLGSGCWVTLSSSEGANGPMGV